MSDPKNIKDVLFRQLQERVTNDNSSSYGSREPEKMGRYEEKKTGQEIKNLLPR
jgi:hypothetical protein